MTHFKRSISLLSAIALTVSLLPTVTAQTVPPTVHIIDNKDVSGFTKEGTWYGENDTGAYNDHYAYAVGGSTNSKATWTFSNIPSGHYRVSATYRSRFNYARFAEFSVFDGIGSRMKNLGKTTVNMRNAPASFTDANGMRWQDLGTTSYFVVTENTLSVSLSGSSDKVIADAVRIERVGELSDQELLQSFADLNASIESNTGGGEGEGTPVTQIDVLALYTDDLLVDQFHNNVTEFQTWVNHAFDCSPVGDTTCNVINGVTISVNGIMQTSAVPTKFVVKNIMRSPISDTPDIDFFTKSVSTNTAVDTARVSAGADIVVSFVKYNNTSLLGYSAFPLIPSGLTVDQYSAATNKNSKSAYILTSHFRAVSTIRLPGTIYGVLTLTHELGHILGAGHENYPGEPAGSEATARAYFINGRFKTLDNSDYGIGNKTPSCPLGCSLVPTFSNPRLGLALNGVTEALGTANADNVTTMSKLVPIVASYSERSSLNSIRFNNPENCLDTDGDGNVSPIDALRVINYLNTENAQADISLISNMRSVLFSYGFLDTNKDGYISPIDSLRIFNYLNNPTDPQFAPAAVCPR